MKKIVLIVFIVLSIFEIHSQCDLPYRPFSEFSNDTLAFLDYNFETRADCYKGKTVTDVIRDLYFNPVSFDNIATHSLHAANKKDGFRGIMLFIRNQGKEKNPLKDYYISIYWEEPIDSEKMQYILKKFGSDNWLPQHYNLFKNGIVENVSSNPYIKMKKAADLRRAKAKQQ